PYIVDEIKAARWTGWGKAAKKLVELHETDHLSDQMAALAWLQKQSFVQKDRIATVGNSFGGIQVVLGMEKGDYCAGVSASVAAQSWSDSEDLQSVMKRAAAHSNGPIFFFQAENDYDLSPTRELSSHMEKSGKIAEVKIYPAFGSSAKEGHSLPWAGVSVWFKDALSFINKHCSRPNVQRVNQ
ncbi:MAG: prolyl oligopeptidase family serine peptidase, partial [Chromatiales bacterium]|nr:prolyl oligopeptidase family serine peptidase [Chromatiales bacterium]